MLWNTLKADIFEQDHYEELRKAPIKWRDNNQAEKKTEEKTLKINPKNK